MIPGSRRATGTLARAIGLAIALAALGVGVGVAIASGGTYLQASRPAVLPAGGTLLSRPWRLRAIHGRVVVIRYTEGDCWGAGKALTSERPKSVTIELRQAYTGGARVACPQFLVVRTLSVHLKAPLGRRRLVHARLSSPPG